MTRSARRTRPSRFSRRRKAAANTPMSTTARSASTSPPIGWRIICRPAAQRGRNTANKKPRTMPGLCDSCFWIGSVFPEDRAKRVDAEAVIQADHDFVKALLRIDGNGARGGKDIDKLARAQPNVIVLDKEIPIAVKHPIDADARIEARSVVLKWR